MDKNNELKNGINTTEPMKDKGGEIYVLLSPIRTQNESMIMGYAMTPVGENVKKHRHPESEECFFVISGEGEVILENDVCINFKQNDAVRIPKNVEHMIKNTGEKELKVVFAAAPLASAMKLGHVNGGK